MYFTPSIWNDDCPCFNHCFLYGLNNKGTGLKHFFQMLLQTDHDALHKISFSLCNSLCSWMLTNKHLLNENKNHFLLLCLGKRSWIRCVCGSLLKKNIFCFGTKTSLQALPLCYSLFSKGKQDIFQADTTSSKITMLTFDNHSKNTFLIRQTKCVLETAVEILL